MKFLDKLNTTPIITQLSNVAGKLKVYSIFIFHHFIIYGLIKIWYYIMCLLPCNLKFSFFIYIIYIIIQLQSYYQNFS